MSDTAVTPTNETTPAPLAPPEAAPAPAAPTEDLSLDGDAPRLGSAPMVPPAPMGGAGVQVPAAPQAPPPELPVVSPVLSAPAAPTMAPAPAPAPAPAIPAAPMLPASVAPTPSAEERFAATPQPFAEADLPTLPSVAPATPAMIEDHPVSETKPLDPTNDHPMAHLMNGKSKPSEASQRAAEIRAGKKAKAKKIKIMVAIGSLAVAAVAGPPLVSWVSNAVNEAGGFEEPTP